MISGSFTDLTWVDFTPGLVLKKSSRGTHLSSSLYHLFRSLIILIHSILQSHLSTREDIKNKAWEAGYYKESMKPVNPFMTVESSSWLCCLVLWYFWKWIPNKIWIPKMFEIELLMWYSFNKLLSFKYFPNHAFVRVNKIVRPFKGHYYRHIVKSIIIASLLISRISP